jgi:hypothetical protein
LLNGFAWTGFEVYGLLIKKGFVYAFYVLLLLIFCKNGLEEILFED